MAKATPPDTGAETGTVTSADGTEIAFERTGSGPPLVMVHGTTADRTSWQLVLPDLAEHVTGYAVDRRGRGDSGDVDAYELEREVEDVIAVLDAIDEPVVLLGHSYGALCALEAARRTDDLRGLVLYDPAVRVGGHEFASEEGLADLETLLEAGENERVVDLVLEEVARIQPALIEALRSAPNWQDRVDAAHTAYRESRAAAEYEFDARRFDGVRAPTLLLSGSESDTRYGAAVEAVDDALPNSRVVIVDGHGHAAHFTALDRFTDEVLAFIRESD